MVAQFERRLDLRQFQDIVDEARRLVPKYCPEWTDFNVSDPGVTLIELFAWMTEMILYQVNRVPDAMYDRFLDMVGVQRRPPEPALADVTFYLSAPMRRTVTIPAGTEVATDRTELQEAIVFQTSADLAIAPPALQALRAWREGQGFEDYMPYISSGLVESPVFNEPPVEGDALYIGYEGDLAGLSLQLRLDCRELEGAHIDPRDPPLAWEYWSRIMGSWQPVRLLDQSGTGRLREPGAPDPTHGLNASGDVYLHVPVDSARQTIDGIEASWVRLRYVTKPGQGYTTSPRIAGLRSECIGATVPARQAMQVRNEFLGESDGSAAKIFPLRERPVLREVEPHVIEVTAEGETTEWVEVEDFSQSTSSDHHFVIHYAKGEVRFGPSVRDREGIERAYGAAPRRGAQLRIRAYHSGGGIIGNVGEGAISQMKTSIPYVASVINYRPSSGGLDEESIEEAKLRALTVLKRPAAAITREDFERIALEVEGVGRARAIAPGSGDGAAPGTVRLLLVPVLPRSEVELAAEDLAPTPALIQAVSARIDERKTLGTLVQYESVPFTWVEIDAHVYVRPGSNAEAAEARALTRLREYFHPISGGPAGRGLNFGAAATVSQVAGVLQSLPEVSYVERVRLRSPGSQNEVTRLQAPGDGLLVLGRCYVLAEVAEE